MTKAKTIDGKICIRVLCFNSFEWAILCPKSALYKAGSKGWRYLCTDFDFSNHSVYEDAEGNLYAIPE